MCLEGSMAPNENRECSDCRIGGCLSCSSSNAYECLKCRTGLLLVNGTCTCSVDGEKVNEDGHCGECSVQGCASCKADDAAFCVKCQDCAASLIDGTCNCHYEDAIWSSLGLCTTQVENNSTINSAVVKSAEKCPENCVECDETVCNKCEDKYYLEKNKCLKCDWRCQNCNEKGECEEAKAGWNLANGNFIQCKTRHCKSCPEISECEECKQGYEMKDGQCIAMEPNGEMTFEEYMRKFGKKYEDEKEYKKRKAIFEANLEAEADMEGLSYRPGINKFADATKEELERLTSYKQKDDKKNKRSTNPKIKLSSSYPSSLNWTA